MSKNAVAVAERPKESVPSVIPEGFGTVDAMLPEQSRIPYVAFAYSVTADKFSNYKAHIKDLQSGEPVLVRSAPSLPVALRPFKYFLLSASQFWAEYAKGTSGAMIRSSATKQDNPFKETVEAVVIVFAPDGSLVPATVRFKGTTCPAYYPAHRALAEAATTEWGRKGPDYSLTMAAPQPWTRFTTSANRITKRNRTTDEDYPTMQGVVHPTTGAEGALLVAFFKNPENLATLDEVKKVYIQRLQDAKKKEVKG